MAEGDSSTCPKAKRSRYFSPKVPEGCLRCSREFFDRSCTELARALLGCQLVSVCGGEACRGRVVEVEAYLGVEDKAAHSYNGRRTNRTEAMYMDPGTAYVYSIYGKYCCFNVSSRGDGAAVLVRALEPVAGLETMRRRRGRRRERELCSGPAKLCQALAIDKSCDQEDMVESGLVWVEEGGCEGEVVTAARVGVDYAEEWAEKPLRYYLKGSPYVSRK